MHQDIDHVHNGFVLVDRRCCGHLTCRSGCRLCFSRLTIRRFLLSEGYGGAGDEEEDGEDGEDGNGDGNDDDNDDNTATGGTE